MNEDFVVICAWCPDSKEKTARAIADGYKVSHGICAACQAKMMAEIPKPVQPARQGDVRDLGVSEGRLIDIEPEAKNPETRLPDTWTGTSPGPPDPLNP